MANLFALALLYRPQSMPSTKDFRAVPEVLDDDVEFSGLVKQAIKTANGCIKGEYSTRVEHFRTRFGLRTMPSRVHLTRLDGHYKLRNDIAHDQGLAAADAPHRPAKSILATRQTVSEREWKKVLRDFYAVVSMLDTGLQESVLIDGGVSLAVYHSMQKSTTHRTVGWIRQQLRENWRIDDALNTNEMVLEAVEFAGLRVVDTGRKLKRHRVYPRPVAPSPTPGTVSSV